MTRQRIICFLLIAVAFSALIGITLFSDSSTQYDIEAGQVSPSDIYATRNITDSFTTAARKEAAANAVADIYVTDTVAADQAVGSANEFMSALKEVLSYKAAEGEEIDKSALLLSKVKLSLSASLASELVSLSSDEYDSLSSVPTYIREVMDNGVTDKDEGISAFSEILSAEYFPEELRSVALALASEFISVNKELDMAATQAARDAAAASVADVTYMKNQTIVRRGEVVSEAQYNMLKDLGFINGSASVDLFHTVSVVTLVTFGAALSVLYYIFRGKRSISASPVASCIICSFLSVVGALLASFGSSEIYLMPLSVCPALVALLLGSDMAAVLNILISIIVLFETGSAETAFAAAVSGLVCALLFSRVRRRTHLLSASLISAAVYGIVYAAFYTETARNVFDILTVLGKGALGAFFGGVLAIGTIPFWEAIFDVITPMKLGELSNPEHKLLKKLMQKAPGSYHHSLTVANMADAAASAIGANSLLARVGAYYHDIGKMNDPLYFKENQLNMINPHDSLEPEESAKIIIKHVKDGAALADSYHLPRAVKNIILRHHGTTTAGYFLYKAKQKNPDVDESIFTYPGPVPQTKEETVIMLADACEAAVRAMREKSDVEARDVVDDIISSRISEGQLSCSALSFADLEKVKESFTQTLNQYFHKRIIYPQNEKNGKKENKNG